MRMSSTSRGNTGPCYSLFIFHDNFLKLFSYLVTGISRPHLPYYTLDWPLQLFCLVYGEISKYNLEQFALCPSSNKNVKMKAPSVKPQIKIPSNRLYKPTQIYTQPSCNSRVTNSVLECTSTWCWFPDNLVFLDLVFNAPDMFVSYRSCSVMPIALQLKMAHSLSLVTPFIFEAHS